MKAEHCPFCVGFDLGIHVTALPHVVCFGCGAEGPISEMPRGTGDSLYDALRLWNSRTQPKIFERKTK